MGRAELQILVTQSHLTNFGWSGELHQDLHLGTLGYSKLILRFSLEGG